MIILSPGLVNSKGAEWSCICVLEISMFPLSAPFLLTKPGERMVMYLCAKDIDVSSFCTFSIDQARRENGHLAWTIERA
jgi:hypothetical protein